MSNSILPHLLSDSPPPLEAEDEDFEDEFGDFKIPDELSFDNEILPMPSSLNDSKNHIPNFSGLNSRENQYEIFNDDEPNNISSEPPPNYCWEQIENNSPEVIDSVQVEDPKKVLDSSENEESKIITISKEFNADILSKNSYDSINGGSQTDLKDYTSPGSEEFFKGITQNLGSVDSSNKCEKNYCFISKEWRHESIIPENYILDKIEPEKTYEKKDIQQISPEHDILVDKITKSEQNDNFHITNERDEIKNHSIASVKRDVCHYAVLTNDVADSDVLQPQKPIDSPINTGEIIVDKNTTEIAPEKDCQVINDDFADFSLFPLKKDNEKCKIQITEDEFHEFGSFQNTSPEQTETCPSMSEYVQHFEDKIEDIDDFDDFTSYAAHKSCQNEENMRPESNHTVFKICSSPEEAFKETLNTIEKLFPKIENTNSDYSNFDFIMNNTVFDNLKDITETNALTYQWDKSVSQKNILKTLNIDVRNILYGSNWNSGVPIFAANLCAKPLEPFKSELQIPTYAQKNVEAQELTPAIPQFDWAEGGLLNLQDCLEIVTEERVENFEDISNVKTKILPPCSAETFHSEVTDETESDFGDFASYQAKGKKTQWNMFPLRESHISTEVHSEGIDTDKISKYFQDLTMGKTENLGIDELKSDSKYTSLESFSNDHVPIASTHVCIEEKFNTIPNQSNSHQIPVKFSVCSDTSKQNDCDIFKTSSSKFLKESNVDIGVKSKKSCYENQGDEFTDFQSSLPPPSEPPMQPALLEPLKPAVLQPESIKHQPLKIEWPDPGLDEEEINRIVNGVFLGNSTYNNAMHKVSTVEPTGEKNKSNQEEDHGDWSDFISVKEPLKTRTSTSHLPLSVLNLGKIQTYRVSAPYVAPNGVVHSPSKTTSLSFPINNRNSQSNTQHSHQQPFITSQAFSALYSNTKNNLLLPNTPIGMSGTNKLNDKSTFLHDKRNHYEIDSLSFTLNSEMNGTTQRHEPLSINHSIPEDDDWGDFVSAPSTVSNSNTNFFLSSSNVKGCKGGFIQKSSTISKNTVVRQQKNNLPIISTTPDLDFISPKSKSTIK